MIKKITHNLSWKIISIVIAFFLWLIVVNNVDPFKRKTFTDIPVEKLNIEAISKEEPKHIDFIKGEYVDVTIEGKRSIIDRLSKQDIKAYVDMKNLSITNAIDIEIERDEDFEVISMKPSNMVVDLEDIITVQKEIQYNYEGMPKEPYMALEPIITPSYIEVTGPESEVARISTVLVTIPIQDETKNVTIEATPRLYDSSDDEIGGDVTLNPTKVDVMVQLHKKKIVPIKVENLNNLPLEFRLIDISSEVESVEIRGREEVVDSVTEISINDISLEDIKSDLTKSINIEEYLPKGVYLNTDESYTFITIDIEPIEQREFIVHTSDITVKNMPDYLQFSFVNEDDFTYIFEGIKEDLDAININTLDPYIRLAGLEEGIHEVEVQYYLPYYVDEITERFTVQILLEANQEEESSEGT